MTLQITGISSIIIAPILNINTLLNILTLLFINLTHIDILLNKYIRFPFLNPNRLPITPILIKIINLRELSLHPQSLTAWNTNFLFDTLLNDSPLYTNFKF